MYSNTKNQTSAAHAHLSLQGNRATYIPLKAPIPENYPSMYPNPTENIFNDLPCRLDVTTLEIFMTAYEVQIIPMFTSMQKESGKLTKPMDWDDLNRVTGELWNKMDASGFQVWTRLAGRYRVVLEQAVAQRLVTLESEVPSRRGTYLPHAPVTNEEFPDLQKWQEMHFGRF